MIASISSTKVLVTGANGFIGLHTTLQLLQLGYEVRATVRNETNKKNVIETLSKHWERTFSTEQAQQVFGWQPRPYEQTIIEMAESLIEFGLVEKV